MSFTDLKAARKTKSYVHPTTVVPKSSALVDASEPDAAASTSTENTQSESSKPVDFDGLYSALPRSALEIRETASSGRGLYAKGSFRPGSVLLSVKPHVAVLSTQHLETHCSSCFGPAPASGLRRCTQCRAVWYCDVECQKTDWASHKQECAALQRLARAAPSEDLAMPSDAPRCIGRMLWKRQKKGLDSSWTKEIDQLQSHRQNLKPSAYELHSTLAHTLVQYLGASSPSDLAEFGISSAADLLDVISRFVTNTFTVSDPSLTPLGASVSPLIALINHSCDPNAVVVFPRSSGNAKTQEPLMQVIAIRDIAPGEEILTAYIDTTPPRAFRQRSLEETYNFTCGCELCAHPSDVDPRESMFCPKSCGGTCPLPTEDNPLARCTKCKAVVSSTDAVLDATRVGQEALDKATALEFKDPAKSTQLTTNLIPILTSAGLTPSSHPLLALSRLHQSLLTSALPDPLTQDHLDDTIRSATRSTTGLSTVLRPGHPVIGIALAELGKLLAVDEPLPKDPKDRAAQVYPPSGPPRVQMAYDTLVKAWEALKVGFGTANEGGCIGKEVRESIVALEKEIGVWKQGVKNVLHDRPMGLGAGAT